MILEVIKTNAHPFLAEYDFRLVIKSHGKEIDVVDMTGDTGGLSRIIVLRLDEHTIAFKDHAKTVCMNLVKKGFEDCLGKRGGLDVGYFDFDSSHKWRFISESVKY